VTHRPRLLVHTARWPMRWGDMDALGHVNNTTYFRYMEQARIEWLETMFAGPDALTPLPIVIVNASCTFLAPLVYPGEVEVRLSLGDPGRTSVGSFYDIRMNGDTHAEGAAKIVWLDRATGRPAPLPAAIARPLQGLAA
jgi:acyl-CoA thioester hydrolase